MKQPIPCERGKRIFPRFRRAFLAIAFVMAIADRAARAENPALVNDQIVILYSQPNASHFKPLAARLKQRRFLEQLKEFLSPLRFPAGVTLRVTLKECGAVNSWWSGRQSGLFLCYEFFDYVQRAAPLETSENGLMRAEAILGGILQVVFHELGHAMIDIFDIPVFGREEDAADQFAAFILSQFGPDIARRTLPGAAHVWQSFAENEGEWPRSAYSDTHGHPLQRAYNFLCLAVGGNPSAFPDLVERGLLPRARAYGCAREFKMVANAFAKTMLPHIDREKMQIVRETSWLAPQPTSESPK